MPTVEQLASRKQLAEFIERVGRPLRNLGAKAKSSWFSRPDEELKGWIERGRAIAEIEDTMGYRMILSQADIEIGWAQNQLEVCDTKDMDQLRCYLKALRFLKDFLLTTNRNADIASGVLAGREGAIGRDASTFVKNARVGE